MALTVENGTGLVDADSYASLATARAIAEKYGVSLPIDDAACEVAIRQGTEYADMQEDCFGGTRLNLEQSLSWPRAGAKTTTGYVIPFDSVPMQMIKASVFAAAEYGTGVDVRANDDGKAIASEQVTGAVAVSYFDNGKSGGTVVITKAIDAMKLLMTSCSNNGFSFRVGRS